MAADLRDAEGDGAEAAGEGFGFITVCVALACVGTLVGLGLEDVVAFEAHGFVDEEAQTFGKAVMAVLGEELQDVVEEFRVVVVGHVMGSSWMCLETPQQETNVARPRPVFHQREAASPLWGSAALGSLRSPSLRLAPKG